MRETAIDMLNELNNSKSFLSSRDLSKRLNISQRTVKNIVQEIKEEYPNVVISTQKGYTVSEEVQDVLAKHIWKTIPETPLDRMYFIIKRSLLSSSIDIFDLSEELLVSDATINKDLAKVRQYLKKYDLDVFTTKGTISIQGKEQNKRRVLNDLHYQEIQKNDISIDSLQKMFPNYDIEEISKIILAALRKRHYFINHYSLLNIVMYIVISIERIKRNFYYESNQSHMIKEGVIENDELKMTVEISNKLEKLYDFEYNEIELEELQTILIGNILVTNSREVDKINLKSLVGKKTIDLVKEMMDDVKEYYYFSEINTDFLTRFSLHVNNLLTRLEINYVNKNPLTNNIKYSCPLLFDCGVKMSHTIYKRTGLQVTDDEIALMVLHLGTLIEEWENDKKKVNGAIIISGYQKVYSDLIEKIEKNFSGINIKRIYSNFEEYQKGSKNDHFDMIITTLPSSNPISDAVNITPFLTETDSKKIDEKIEEVRVAKEKGHLRDLLGEVTDKAFFRKNSECREKNTIIKQLCTDFVEKNITSDTFTEEVLKREELSSTAFGRIAVPHSFNMDANKTMISISIYEKPITWEGKEVNVVFLFAVNDTKKRVFQEIFDNLIIKLADLPDIDRLANSRHYEEFIENLLSLLN